jgi:hypothetical protein
VQLHNEETNLPKMKILGLRAKNAVIRCMWLGLGGYDWLQMVLSMTAPDNKWTAKIQPRTPGFQPAQSGHAEGGGDKNGMERELNNKGRSGLW